MKPILALPVLLALLITACSTSTTKTGVQVGNTELSRHIDAKWLSGNEEAIAERIVSYIRSAHPETDPSFPRLKIDRIQIENSIDTSSRKDEIQKSFEAITNSVVSNLLPYNAAAKTWHADIVIAIRDPKLSKNEEGLLYAYMVPAMGLCWGSAFVLCPVKETEVVVVQLNAVNDNGQHIKVEGIGASTLYQQSVLANDSSDGAFTGHHERNTKAFVAAVADVVDKLIVSVSKNP